MANPEPISAVPSGGPATLRAPIWPVILAPLAALWYYLTLWGAFRFSLTSALPDAGPSLGVDTPWGSHWLYRSLAEITSVSFGAFIAAGIAQKRAQLAGFIAGLTISVFWISVSLGIFLISNRQDLTFGDPWYQYVIIGGVVLGAPFAGRWTGKVVAEMALRKPDGFLGINRWHFVWLSLPAALYAECLIAPLLHFLIVQFVIPFNIFGAILNVIAAIPVLVYAIPAIWGLGVLAHESKWSRTKDNLLGPVILMIGWLIATGVAYLWSSLMSVVARGLS